MKETLNYFIRPANRERDYLFKSFDQADILKVGPGIYMSSRLFRVMLLVVTLIKYIHTDGWQIKEKSPTLNFNVLYILSFGVLMMVVESTKLILIKVWTLTFFWLSSLFRFFFGFITSLYVLFTVCVRKHNSWPHFNLQNHWPIHSSHQFVLL